MLVDVLVVKFDANIVQKFVLCITSYWKFNSSIVLLNQHYN